MDRTQLMRLTVIQLRAIAEKRKLTGYSKLRKGQLVALLLPRGPTATEPTRARSASAASQARAKDSKSDRNQTGVSGQATTLTGKSAPLAKPARPARIEVVPAGRARTEAETKTEPTPPVEPSAESTKPFDEHHGLPDSYGQPLAVLMPKNPEWLFLYWDFDDPTRSRLSDDGNDTFLMVFMDGREVLSTPTPVEGKRHYIRVPGGGGRVEAHLGSFRDGRFQAVLISNAVVVPSARVSENHRVSYVASSWIQTERQAEKSPGLLPDEQYRAFFGDIRTDVPWYRPKK